MGKYLLEFPGFHNPQARISVVTPRQQPVFLRRLTSLRTEREGPYRARMVKGCPDLLSAFYVPKTHFPVATAGRQQSAVGTDGDREDRLRMRQHMG